MELTAEEYSKKYPTPKNNWEIYTLMEQFAQEKDKRIAELEKECEGWEARVSTYEQRIKELEDEVQTLKGIKAGCEHSNKAVGKIKGRKDIQAEYCVDCMEWLRDVKTELH